MVAPVHRFSQLAESKSDEDRGSATERHSPGEPAAKPKAKRNVAIWLSHGDRVLMVVFCGIAFVAGAAYWIRANSRTFPPVVVVRVSPETSAPAKRTVAPEMVTAQKPIFEVEHRVDINTATAAEFRQLHGIGKVLSARIVANRNDHGPFESVSDLRRVPGIGKKTLDKLRPHLVCSPPAR